MSRFTTDPEKLEPPSASATFGAPSPHRPPPVTGPAPPPSQKRASFTTDPEKLQAPSVSATFGTGAGATADSKAPAAAAGSTSAAVTAVGLAPAVDAHCHVLVDLRFDSPSAVAAFLKALPAHFAECRKEPLLIRINCLQSTKDALHLTIVEEYKGLHGFLAHKQTAHYQQVWPQAKAHVKVAAGEMYQTVL